MEQTLEFPILLEQQTFVLIEQICEFNYFAGVADLLAGQEGFISLEQRTSLLVQQICEFSYFLDITRVEDLFVDQAYFIDEMLELSILMNACVSIL